jgi:hypothetical protein
MLNTILELLKDAKGETENIRIAQGKYKLPSTFKDSMRQIKNEINWKKKDKLCQ